MRRFIKKIQQGFIFFGQCVSTIINAVLLLIVYVVGVGLTTIVAKCARKHFLVLNADHKSPTYWQDCDTRTRTLADYYRQF